MPERIAGVLILLCSSTFTLADLPLDQQPAGPGQWGYRPAEGTSSAVNPPSFSWRPQNKIVSWDLECRRASQEEDVVYQAEVIGMNVHCPPRAFPPGTFTWRYRGKSARDVQTNWSKRRTFTVPAGATHLPMPTRHELLARIPTGHPRLFLRPEDLPVLRALAREDMKPEFDALVKQCERWLRSPPSTVEPSKYPRGMVRNSDAWREMWWGNRRKTIETLNGAATLAFTRLLGGKDAYGHLAKRILLDCAQWDPTGATGYRYNDEAGMPYNYYFARTYSFVNDLLDEEEKQLCRRVMKIRGDEMYRHLYPRHFWRPYSSHSNRAWHFLGEVGIAMLGEVEGADDWVWFAANVFYNVYPVWSDDDGGWHEGLGYWASYIHRFTWWADVMRSSMNINAYDMPYFSKIGYYPMYLMPPNKVGGGFGDLNASKRSSQTAPLMSQLATQSGNGHWQWYVNQMGGPRPETGYIGFVRGSLPPVVPQSPKDLPTSRLFHGTGQAVLNTNLTDARKGVQVVFKSSPFGTASHGYEANNSFLLWAYGRRLLIRSGYRDSYGTEHHKRWMWSTRSVNNITVNGEGQLSHSQASQGGILAFKAGSTIDVVVGEAGNTYRDSANGSSRLQRFTRTIVFVKPDLVVVYDQLSARKESTFDYWLHATQAFDVINQHDIRLRVGDVCCSLELLTPENLQFSQTDQYDPNPRPRIKLREWHLTARTPSKSKHVEFIAVLRPYRAGETKPGSATLETSERGYVLTAPLAGGSAKVLLPIVSRIAPSETKTDEDNTIRVTRFDQRGTVIEKVESRRSKVVGRKS